MFYFFFSLSKPYFSKYYSYLSQRISFHSLFSLYMTLHLSSHSINPIHIHHYIHTFPLPYTRYHYTQLQSPILTMHDTTLPSFPYTQQMRHFTLFLPSFAWNTIYDTVSCKNNNGTTRFFLYLNDTTHFPHTHCRQHLTIHTHYTQHYTLSYFFETPYRTVYLADTIMTPQCSTPTLYTTLHPSPYPSNTRFCRHNNDRNFPSPQHEERDNIKAGNMQEQTGDGRSGSDMRGR